jgi:hypothetical protein
LGRSDERDSGYVLQALCGINETKAQPLQLGTKAQQLTITNQHNGIFEQRDATLLTNVIEFSAVDE